MAQEATQLRTPISDRISSDTQDQVQKLAQGLPAPERAWQALDRMAVVPLDAHNVLDYVFGGILLACPSLAGFSHIKRASNLFYALGGGAIAYSALTQYRFSLAKVIPLGVHMALDSSAGVTVISAPSALGYGKFLSKAQKALHWALGLGVIGLVAMTRNNGQGSVVSRSLRTQGTLEKIAS